MESLLHQYYRVILTTVMYLDFTFYYYHYYHYERFITSITTHSFGSNGIITSLLPLHYVLSTLLLPIITVITPETITTNFLT